MNKKKSKNKGLLTIHEIKKILNKSGYSLINITGYKENRYGKCNRYNVVDSEKNIILEYVTLRAISDTLEKDKEFMALLKD